MVSSASFRAQLHNKLQYLELTSILQFNGQTDFNTISTYDFDEISIRHGGRHSAGSAIG
jgi:hypothetical protein